MNFKNTLIDFFYKARLIIPNHRFLSFANICAFTLAFLPFLYCLILFEFRYKVSGLLFLVPFVFIYPISLLLALIAKKFHWIGVILSLVWNSCIIILFQILIGTFVFIYAYQIDSELKSNNIKTYPLAVKRIYYKKAVEHFPKKIPNNAKNPYIETSTVSFHGSEDIYFTFFIDKEYIEEELKKHHYIKVLSEKEFHNNYCFYTPHDKMNEENLTFYIINDKDSEKLPDYHHKYYYGIAINKDKNYISYFYVDPD